jgi:hypothetical protein
MTDLPIDFPTEAILNIVDAIRKGEVKNRLFAQSLWVLAGFAIGQSVHETKPYGDDAQETSDGSEISMEDFTAMLEQITSKGYGPQFGMVPWILIARVAMRLIANFF